VTIPAVIDIENRIAAIQQRFAGSVPGAVQVGTAGGVLGASTSGSGASFARDLQAASSRLAGTDGSWVAAGSSGNRATPTGADVVAMAKTFLGVPYVWGGNDPKTGLDCSGLTELVYARLGIDIPPVSWQQARAGRTVSSIADAKPGDLLTFNSPVSHVGIYIGDGKMIHAPRPGERVEISPVYDRPTAIRRVLPDSAVQPTAAFQSTASAATPPVLAAHSGPLAAGTPYAVEFRAAADRSGIPARVLAALAKVESSFRADAVSPAGAQGLMQLMPATARELGVDPMSPASAIDGAARLLARHVRALGSLELGLAAYNAGEGAVRKYGGIPPYAETRNHVATVMAILRGSST
jgi:cell wall-associated NlpC family hydrolase